MQLLGDDIASGKTPYAIHRGRGWPCSSVRYLPELRTWYADDTDIHWQQDGAPNHHSKKTMSYLKGPELVQGRAGILAAASPDLNVLDWSVWGPDQAPPRADRVLCSFVDTVVARGRILERLKASLTPRPCKPTS